MEAHTTVGASTCMAIGCMVTCDWKGAGECEDCWTKFLISRMEHGPTKIAKLNPNFNIYGSSCMVRKPHTGKHWLSEICSSDIHTCILALHFIYMHTAERGTSITSCYLMFPSSQSPHKQSPRMQSSCMQSPCIPVMQIPCMQSRYVVM